MVDGVGSARGSLDVGYSAGWVVFPEYGGSRPKRDFDLSAYEVEGLKPLWFTTPKLTSPHRDSMNRG